MNFLNHLEANAPTRNVSPPKADVHVAAIAKIFTFDGSNEEEMNALVRSIVDANEPVSRVDHVVCWFRRRWQK